MKKINIHFVCRENVCCSRLAEAYLKSSGKADAWNISSSGICVEKHTNHLALSPWVARIANDERISQWLSGTKTQTTNEILDRSDLIIFMSRDAYEEAKRYYHFNEAICLIWDINGAGNRLKGTASASKGQETYRRIKRNVNQLIKDVSAGSWVNIVDDHNVELGFKLPVTIANKKSLWHRVCHAIITTPDHSTLVQQRSKNMIFAPNLIDITLGGHVDTGETPEQAMVREIKEEMGLTIDPAVLHLLEISKWNKYHPHYKRRTKTFVYAYHVPIAETKPLITIEKEEVQAVKLLSPGKLKRLVAFRTLVRVGRLNYSYAYYSRIIKLVEASHTVHAAEIR